ncbi:hypothetical protein [Halapricum hydrolyticum]|uniref:Uncharacterized protein n=1 Tax=Halapricum hydrolyticum TaxID=2979991 RepID=A0AAE3LDY2_9EURY|nr:hypothetical protein [Halapricum hydrolyticum]MCU4716738.1 hypothetical protein [Halapricum hydrolyticum]MCU4725657.1 hypothetical protein [Halapricum hydrolyticum]
MSSPTTPRFDSETLYEEHVAGDRQCGEPDTAIAVTESGVYVRPIAESGGPLEFALGHEEITGLQCHGMVNRSIAIETDDASYEIPTTMLDERRFRQAIVERSGLSNPCRRLVVDRLGVCPCTAGSSLGCLLIVAGIGLVLSVFGALLGIGAIAAGAALLLLAYMFRKVSTWRGANRWERTNGPDQPTV